MEIHHGGRFVEVGGGRFEYNGGEVHWLERIDPDKFSWTDLNSFAWRLGYRNPPVYYWFKYHAKPKYLPIRTDKEAMGMFSNLPKARKVEVYYVGGGVRDVVVCEKEDQMKEFLEVVPHLRFIPEIVMVPLKVADMGNGKGKMKELDIENSEGEEGIEDDDDGVDDDVDDKFIDSDYELNPEDDDERCGFKADDIEFRANVDDVNEIEEWTDMGFAGEISENSQDSAELQSMDEESEDEVNDGSISSKKKKKIKGKHWVPERDMKTPHFELGQHFDNRFQFKNAVRHYAVLNGANLHFQKNDKKQALVVCGKKQKGKRSERKCPFWLYASSISDDSPIFVVKTCDLIHKNFPLVARVNMCTTTYLAESYKKRWKADPYMSRKNFQDTVQDDLKQNISVKQVWRTRQKALKLNEGSEAQQYNLLMTYANVLQETNPNITGSKDRDGGGC